MTQHIDPDDLMEAAEWLSGARNVLLPRMKDSALTIQLVPGDDPDPKIAVELGYTILLDKPPILVVPHGRSVPERLRRAADRIFDYDDLDLAEKLTQAVEELCP